MFNRMWLVWVGLLAVAAATAMGNAAAPGLVVTPAYGEGATARWWVRTQAPELVVLVAPVLNGAAGCYMAVNPAPPMPRVWVYNPITGDWNGDGDVCRAEVEAVREEDGGGVRLVVTFGGRWLVGAGAGKQTLWVMERGGGVEGWRRAGVWVVGSDAGGVEWVRGEPIPLPAPVPQPPPPPPPPPTVTVTATRVQVAPGDTLPVPPRGCWWARNGVVQTPGVDYLGVGVGVGVGVVVGEEDLLTCFCVEVLP